MKEVVFYYDVVCPFAFIARKLIEGVARRTGAKIRWKPVLLGGLYKGTQAPQGAAGSAYDDMCASKIKILADGPQCTVPTDICGTRTGRGH
ncbi:unnamed protein product [Porites lobata]|uniref:DSBA-like thioredoxin domain-containing protein n=1 Tax=Porites lobata TaxID=104759 RepID=A0ABN8NEM3_9CNID|nr:unnamed protein product [Porites lobata]